MCEQIKIKLDQSLQVLDVLLQNQRLIRNDRIEDDLTLLFKRFSQERQTVKQLEYQLKSVILKTKSQSQQIQDQRRRRLIQSNRADRLHKTIRHIYEWINYRGQHTSPIDQLHYIKKICEDRLREDKCSSDDEDDDIDSHNCTIDEDPTESLVQHPRVVLPQSSSRKRLINDASTRVSPSKRLRLNEKTTYASRPIVLPTDSQMMDSTLSIDQSSKNESTSSMEQTLPNSKKILTKLPMITHRFISKKIFRPETCFVCEKRINFGSIAYRCSSCSQSFHTTCRETSSAHCPSSHTANLSRASPKTPTIVKFKLTHRQRMVNSEPRPAANVVAANPSTVQRRLPFERILLLKK